MKRHAVWTALTLLLATLILYALPLRADMTDSIDPEFIGGTIQALAVQPDDKILIGERLQGTNHV